MVEIDVLARDNGLVVAHDDRDLRRSDLLSLSEALGLLEERLSPAMRLNIDLKATGYEAEVLAATDARGLTQRCLFSSMELESLLALRRAAPEARLGWSVPRARRDYVANPLTRPLAAVALAYYRRSLPGETIRQICRGLVDVVMAYRGVVTAQLADAVFSVGGELYVWTVDDPTALARLSDLRVTGVVTNDLSIFAKHRSAAADR